MYALPVTAVASSLYFVYFPVYILFTDRIRTEKCTGFICKNITKYCYLSYIAYLQDTTKIQSFSYKPDIAYNTIVTDNALLT